MCWSDKYNQVLYPIELAYKEGFSEIEELLKKPFGPYNYLKNIN